MFVDPLVGLLFLNLSNVLLMVALHATSQINGISGFAAWPDVEPLVASLARKVRC